MAEEKYVRPTWDEYFMEVAKTIAKTATTTFNGLNVLKISTVANYVTAEISPKNHNNLRF